MSQFKLILKTFIFYWKNNLVVALGIAISTVVISGSLVVGDSVEKSLSKQVGQRLGKATHILTAGDRFFSTGLGSRIEEEKNTPTAPLMVLRGIAVADGGQNRVPDVQILGVDGKFDYFAGTEDYFGSLKKGEVIVSENLASKLSLEIDDRILFRIKKASLIPMNAPFVSADETSVAVRVKVVGIADSDNMGRFDLSNSQTAPMNAFFDISYINEVMDLGERANLILIESEDPSTQFESSSYAAETYRLEDYSLQLDYLPHLKEWELNTERVFLEDHIKNKAVLVGEGSNSVFTYFVNYFRAKGNYSPYSFVSSVSNLKLKEDEIKINSWLADDLGLEAGDSIELEYFVVGPLRELEEKKSGFIISGIFGMDDNLADSSLMPFLPGLSDAGSCSEWETGVPIDLDKIRDKDEDYWDEYKGTPKALISLETSQSLWANRFGQTTAIRYPGDESRGAEIEKDLLKIINPSDLGFQIRSAKFEGENAAQGQTDFGQLFIGLSFFLLAAGVILSLILFLLNIDRRKQQLGTFSAMGFSRNTITKLVLGEGLFSAVFGIVIGLILTVYYNKIIFAALNTIWYDIVRTDSLEIFFSVKSLLSGAIISLVIFLLSAFFVLRRYFNRKLVDLNRMESIRTGRKHHLIKSAIKWFTLIMGLGIIVYQFIDDKREDSGLFFMAGGMLLVSFLLFSDSIYSLKRLGKTRNLTVNNLSLLNGVRNRSRTLSVIVMFAIGVFLVVTTGANRKDPGLNSQDKQSGTGGFTYVAQATVPVLFDLNNEGVRFNFGLEGDYQFTQFRKMSGDDASCLNLNKVQNPAILGVDPDDLDGRFSFAASTEFLSKSNPWKSLATEIGDGIIPAIADQTIIKWGLGLSVGDTLYYQDESGRDLKLLLIGGLANSVLQGNVIIDNKFFLSYFPSSSGSSFFLLDGFTDEEKAQQELGRGLRDYGWDMESSVERLAEFSSIENTYLMIFLILGALGLLIGTVGLGVILVRNLLERKQELALLSSLGFSKIMIIRMIVVEYAVVLGIGMVAGGLSAIVAVLPGLLKPNSEVSPGFLLLIIGVILLNGLLWISGLAYKQVRKTNLLLSLRND